jgi:hypothetical protein
MKTRRDVLLAMGFLFSAGASVQAQSSASASASANEPASTTLKPAQGISVSAGLSNALGIATTSKAGAPYSLVQETHRSSTLADGTHIEETSRTAHMYRDSEGRTRMEVYISMPHGSERAPELAFVTIIDPVAGKSYSLNPHTQTATETGFPFAGTLSRNAPTPSVGAGSGVVFQTRTPAMAESAPQMTHESLGPQEMDGVTVTGTRFTQTFPVGSIGNDRPIVVVRTIWHSEELGIDMLGEVSDPRTGNVTTRVTQLDRTEPDPALFQVPADYQITEAPARQ